MDFNGVNIGDIVLQQPPFRFVDRLVEADEQTAITSYMVPEAGFLVRDSRLEEGGVLENFAQSSAAWVGYISKYIRKIPVRIGFVGQVRDFRIERLPLSGETLTTRVEVLHEVFGITSVKAGSFVNDEPIATAILKTALKDG